MKRKMGKRFIVKVVMLFSFVVAANEVAFCYLG
jgi:hypothetical protein